MEIVEIETIFWLVIIGSNLLLLRSHLKLHKRYEALLKENEEQWLVFTVKDKEKIDEIMTKMNYTNPHEFIQDAYSNHVSLFEMLSEGENKRLAIARLNQHRTGYEIEKTLQPVGMRYSEMNKPVN